MTAGAGCPVYEGVGLCSRPECIVACKERAAEVVSESARTTTGEVTK